jgi:hypothetical protein
MNNLMRTFAARLAVAMALAAVLAACAATPGQPGPGQTAPGQQPESLGESAQARWDALLEGDFGTAYGYLSPGSRSSISEIDYAVAFKLRKVQYDSARYMDHECEGDTCTVRMDMGYTLIAALRGVPEWKGKAVVEEKWVRIDGKWWFLP